MAAYSRFNLDAATDALKELYDGQRVTQLIYEDNPFLARLRKQRDFFGEVHPLPMNYSPGSGASSSFSKTQTNQTAAKPIRFLVTRARGYGIAELDHETMLAMSNDIGAFVDAAQFLIDNEMQAQANMISHGLFGDGTGKIGVLAEAIGATTTGQFQLANPDDSVFFNVNDALTIYDDTNTTQATGSALIYVTAVDRDNGIISVANTQGGTTDDPTTNNTAVGDLVFIDGSRNANSGEDVIQGLGAWIPATAPTSGDSFFGVNRSIDTTKLAGVRYDGSNQSIEEALIEGSAKLAREGGRPDDVYVNFETWSALEQSLGSKVQYIDHNVGEVAFQAIRINGPKGQMRVYADRSCPANTAYMLTSNSWVLKSLYEMPMILEQDNLRWLRLSDADAAEIRVGWYGQLECLAPNKNANITLSVS